ncbi:PrgI family protein [Clostridium arbusti]|uniref:PrgI family protein n=1 Tax=Clostridium arbusti TaxID=1137848 RepID=UPI000287C155|nr:PrgI family protein [Clostridium arbusti]
MIDIKIPKEIRSYKEKIYFGLNLRQLICTGLSIAIVVPMYIFGKQYIGDDIASWLVIIVSIPPISVGFVKYNGMNFEEFILSFIRFSILYPQKRKYKTENLYEVIENYIEKEEKKAIAKKKINKKIKEGAFNVPHIKKVQ